MQLSGKVSEEELNDVRRVAQSKWYWPKLVVRNFYGVILLGVILWITIEGLLGRAHPSWRAMGGIWLAIFGIVALSYYRVKKAMRKEFSQLNATLPDWVILVDEGVKLSGPAGATGFLPWNNFKGWREGSGVILLDTKANSFVILPVTNFSDTERQSIREFVRLRVTPDASAAVRS